MAEWWKDLKEGEPRVFGFLQVDIAGHSNLPGPNAALMRTKANLRRQISGINSIYGVQPLSWAGDGGIFALLINKPESYDLLACCALQVLETVSFFNKMKGISNVADSPVSVRISCHAGQAIFNRDGSLFHGSELSAFRKNERKIGVPNSVVLTEAVYNQLIPQVLRSAFTLLDKEWQYKAEGQSKKLRLYISRKPSEKERPKLKIVQKELTWQNMEKLVARAFSKLGAEAKINVVIQGIQADLLLEEKTATGPITTLVECKAYKSPVGVSVVREFYARLLHLQDHVQRGVIVSTNGFTTQAMVIAQSKGIQLETIDELIQRSGGLDALPELPPEARTRPERVLKRAYVIMPFKGELTDVYYLGIRPPLEQGDYVVELADDIQFMDGVLVNVREAIEEADLIVVEITDPDPNIYYEIGLAQSLNKRIILITQSVENLPLDFREMSYVVYEKTDDLREKLAEAVGTVEKQTIQ